MSDMIVELRDKKIDISSHVPLKLKDWKVLEKKGITPSSMQEIKVSDISEIIFYILNKADNSVKQDDVDNLDLGHPVIKQVIGSLNKSAELDRPSSTSSS